MFRRTRLLEVNKPSSRSKSGSQNRARAKASLIRQPPEKVFVGYCCLSGENPRPAKIVAARDSALSDSISASFAWISLKVISRPSLSWSNLAASVDVSAIEDLSASRAANCFPILLKGQASAFQTETFSQILERDPTSWSIRRRLRHTSASKTA